MKVYVTPYGPFPRRILLYLAVKGITDVEVVNLITIRGETRTPEFYAKHFSGKVPLLELDDGRLVHESQPILQYLEDLYPEPPMMGENEAERRRVDLQVNLINEFYYYCFPSVCHTHPYLCRMVDQCHGIDLVTAPLWRSRMERISAVLGDDKWLAGNRVTIADCMLFGVMEYLRPMYDLFIPAHLYKLLEWYDRFRALPGLPLLKFPEWYYDEYIARYGDRTGTRL